MKSTKSFFLLKTLVAVMTMSIVIGFGFILYGLVRSPKAIPVEKFSTIQVPEEANFLSYHFHGNTITILYSCGDSVIFYSMYENGSKGIEKVRRIAPEPYSSDCSIDELTEKHTQQ